MRYLSDVNLRAVLSILVAREGGAVDISNADLYAAMLPGDRRGEGFAIEETGTGIRISVATDADAGQPGRQ
ncbi:hypothetical protein BJY16_008735 [Actinoplanes octamycinicus]|uniref:Uncharacterized protein n=1 Tax=Actinoplanes octamycinicus TaxID=135948 RepID=A0A7W7MCL8_9ACTN|nr:hypothetical protein [Actinoplanes octamycinicus]MBB4745276.1 hypothetical protein [Actinoplanes octamycinicus]GIE62245.1 hypothetical protein Aoc01nite_76470 [Actinoplanes octamycinicus]